MQKNYGIILKTYFPYNYKIVLFDAELGKIESILRIKKNQNYRLCNGMLINYLQTHKNNKFFIHDIEIIELPYISHHSQFLFFHHILELCYFFLPNNMKATEIFDLINFFYKDSEKLKNIQAQKIFLCKLLLLLGIYPENIAVEEYFEAFFYNPIDNIIDKSLDLKFEKKLSSWIMTCINMHPQANLIKTKNFLTKVAVS